jgi:hypothetical protein
MSRNITHVSEANGHVQPYSYEVQQHATTRTGLKNVLRVMGILGVVTALAAGHFQPRDVSNGMLRMTTFALHTPLEAISAIPLSVAEITQQDSN